MTESLRAAFTEARRGLRARRRRSVLTALGIALAASMLSAALVIADGLGLGFDRAARAAGLPDIIVRFDSEPRSRVLERIAALPDLAGFGTRLEHRMTRAEIKTMMENTGLREIRFSDEVPFWCAVGRKA